FQSKINSPVANFRSETSSALPTDFKCSPTTFHDSSAVCHPFRSMPLKRLLCPSHTFAHSSGFGLVLGSSLIFRFLKWHSAPSLSSARYPFRGTHLLTPQTSLPLTSSLMTPSLAVTL